MASSTTLTEFDSQALLRQKPSLLEQYASVKQLRLQLDMTRGRPSKEQLDLAAPMLGILGPHDYLSAALVDCRNYGGLDGLPEAKALLAPLLGVSPDELIVGGNSSLTLMHDCVQRALSHGAAMGSEPWLSQGKIKFLCPVPGYDRHFAICEHLGIEMVSIEMQESGPDMDAVEQQLQDPRVKGIWLVPQHQNPTGYTLSDEAVQRLASVHAAADFRIFWDNAYAVHHLTDSPRQVANILEACRAHAVPDRPLLFGSTSKISFAGAGLAVMGASRANLDWMLWHLSKTTIGPDKLNQLRHVRFFQNFAGIQRHMLEHARLLRPKFQAVADVLLRELEGLARWTRPEGGYFVSLDTVPGAAARVVELAAQAGVKFTGAGATFPYERDPNDQNIRIAPTLPDLSEVEQAMQVLCVCVKLATLELVERAGC